MHSIDGRIYRDRCLDVCIARVMRLIILIDFCNLVYDRLDKIWAGQSSEFFLPSALIRQTMIGFHFGRKTWIKNAKEMAAWLVRESIRKSITLRATAEFILEWNFGEEALRPGDHTRDHTNTQTPDPPPHTRLWHQLCTLWLSLQKLVPDVGNLRSATYGIKPESHPKNKHGSNWFFEFEIGLRVKLTSPVPPPPLISLSLSGRRG